MVTSGTAEARDCRARRQALPNRAKAAATRRTRLTTADLVVLSVFLYAGPMHGYELVRRLEAGDMEDWAPVSRPQVYYSLRKLAEGGYLLSAVDTAPALGPTRTVYRAARKARTAMRSALRDPAWVEKQPPSPFITWAALALNAPQSTVDAQMDRRRAFLEAEIERESATLVSLEGGDGRDVAVARALVRMVIRQLEGELASLADLRGALMPGDD